MLAFGATACLAKSTEARDVLHAIHLASRGLHVLPPSTGPVARGADTAGPELLTPREAEVLELLQAGRSNAEIAHELHVSVETVRTHARQDLPQAGGANAARAARAAGGLIRRLGRPIQAARAPDSAPAFPARSSSAICTALVAAPLRRLSPTTHMLSACGCDRSSRSRPTNTSSRPSARKRRWHVLEDQAGASASSCRASSTLRSAHASGALTDSEWPTRTGTRTQVTRDPDRLVLQDLARLEHHLALLVGVVIAVGESCPPRRSR